ncbi:Aste57867_14121 [Aphanomyces stellatus]|uniref:Aste57867_14121 protein n=1 Tax=Aphanomyces stellatus TaxID=120398 RepID=A0A485KZV4_9STRA|nr:hypothetical protein As57867_014070 [Aphanomyces stellatus]VFT90948.1 Aste57867_14121 [Aphanomyces stellatus]
MKAATVAAVVAWLTCCVDAACVNFCSGHGFCNTFDVCQCTQGYFGGDCSLGAQITPLCRTHVVVAVHCPQGNAWGVISATDTAHQMTECSGRGICATSSGTCTCQTGFSGAACETIECIDSCSGRGRCITMEQLAATSLVASNLNDAPPFAYSPYVMWDADMIQGCLCDDGYTSNTCLISKCHTGVDPLSVNQTEEVQLISCTASYLQHTITLNYDTPPTAGTFVLQFGLQQTTPINFNAPAANAGGASMKEMLQTLTTIPSVTVSTRNAAGASFWDVTFPPTALEQHRFRPQWRSVERGNTRRYNLMRRVVEVQTFFCAADSGFLTLQYNKYLFGNIPYSALASDLVAKLQTYWKIGTVQVTYSQGTTLCQAAGNQVTIAFTLMYDRNFIGDLPELIIDTTNQAQRNGLYLGGLAPVVDAVATEVVKGLDTCNQVEVQSFVCGAMSGYFTMTFQGTTLSNIPFSIAAADLRTSMLSTFTTLLDIDVSYSSGATMVCDPIGQGTTTTIAFVIATTLGPNGNGDLGAITTDINNGGVNGLAHASPNLLQLTATAVEVVKGMRCVPLSSTFVANPTRQITSTVVNGGGGFIVGFRGQSTRMISATASAAQVTAALLTMSAITNITVTFTTGEACATPPNVIRLNFTQEFGNLPTVTVNPQGTPAMLQVFSSGAVEPTTLLASFDGTKDNMECSGRGDCNFGNGGYCQCYTGCVYVASNGRNLPATRAIHRDDCGAMSDFEVIHALQRQVVVVTACVRAAPNTNAHVLSGGEAAIAPNVGVCPFGLSWFSYPLANNVAHRNMAECSNAGQCDRTTALCMCSAPYTGPACEYMTCAGVSTQCSGHGRCLTLNELAPFVTVNGVLGGFTFGSDPNNPYTWEANKIQSCLCDPPFYGHDCSLVDCPHGDDPNTYLDMQEVQHIQCLATGGTFTITFRQQTTGPIPWNANLATVQQALQSLPTIQQVGLVFSGSSTTQACAATGSGVFTAVTFIYELGALPCLQVDKSLLENSVASDGTPGTGSLSVICGGATVSGRVSIVGTRENAVCSNHGVCDTQLGICNCHPYYASSDGLGNPGTRGDCGYRTLLAKSGDSAP